MVWLPSGISLQVVVTVLVSPPVTPSTLAVAINSPPFLNSTVTLASPSPSFDIIAEITISFPSIKSPENDKSSIDKSASVVRIFNSESLTLPGVSEFNFNIASASNSSLFSITALSALTSPFVLT